MLAEHQVRFLLERAEAIVGSDLVQIRGNLRSKRNSRHAIWELILMDAAAEIGRIRYEPPTPGGRALDVLLDVEGGIWLEAAYLEPRFRDVLQRQEAFTARLRKEEQRRGLPQGSVQRDFYGDKTDAGFNITIPAENELTTIFNSAEVRAFFNDVATNRDQQRKLDLAIVGVSVILTYVGLRLGSVYSIGGSPVIEAPRTVEEHALFRLLDEKGKKYRDAGITQPVMIYVGTEQSPSLNRLGAPLVLSPRQAIEAALKKYRIIAGVVLLSLESSPPVFGLTSPRQPRVEAYLNNDALFPLSARARTLLSRMRFDRVDYGHSWNEWDGAKTIEERLDRQGGPMHVRNTKNGLIITVPLDLVLESLGTAAGGMNVVDSNYRINGMENPFRRARAEGRPIVGFTMLPHDKRRSEPQMVEIELGASAVLLLQTRG